MSHDELIAPTVKISTQLTHSELLYDWRFTASQFVFASSPLRLKIKISFFFLMGNDCEISKYTTTASPARSVFNSRFLVTDVNSGDSSASQAQVLPVRGISRN
jgi:hypothetical protein